MFKAKRSYIIIFCIITLGLLIQLFRLNLIINWDNAENTVKEINLNQMKNLGDKNIEDYKKTYLVIYTDDEYSLELIKNTEMTLHYTKRKYELCTIQNIPKNLSKYDHILFAFNNFDLISDFSVFIDYINNGGSLAFLVFPDPSSNNFKRFYRKFGITEYGDYSKTNGFSIEADLFLNDKRLVFSDGTIIPNVFSVRLDENCDILINSNSNNPILWKKSVGLGNILIFNAFILSENSSRGLLSGILDTLTDFSVHPIVNAKTIFIDDFPSPFTAESEKLFDEYGRSYERFIKDVWWPDILTTVNIHNIVYTGLFIETYNKDTKPPYARNQSIKGNIVILGRDILKNKGEIGLHGYNHQPLTTNPLVSELFDYTPWDDKDEMKKSLQFSLTYMKELFPNYKVRTYVPPSNIMDLTGREATLEAMPDLNVISGVNTGYDLNYVQDLSYNDSIVEYPRYTAGSFYNTFTKWSMANTVSLYGVVSHFIHPDDIIDENRSQSLSWQKLFSSYTDLLSNINKSYPWLESMTASQAGEKTKNYLSSDTAYIYKENELIIYCENFYDQLDVLVYSTIPLSKLDTNIKKLSNHYYLVTLTQTITKLSLEDKP